MEKDLYKILGVEKSATKSDIQKAFHKLAKKYHPDMNPDSAESEQKFKEINLAYEVLKDPKKRAKYDQMREMGAFAHAGQGRPGQGHWQGGNPFGGFGGAQGPGGNFGDMGLGELFEEIFGGFSGFDPATGGPKGAHVRRRGADQETELIISFVEAARGGERTLEFSNGKRIVVKVPAGVDDGSKIKLRGQGEEGLGGGPSGDLIIKLKVLKHEYFTRDKNDILVFLPISFSEAVLGGQIQVPTLDGNVLLKIPSGISSGQRLKMKGKGITERGGTSGDQYVEIIIKVPKKPSKSYTDAAKKLQNTNFNPREDY